MEFWTSCPFLSKVRLMPAALADSYEAWVDSAVVAEQLGFDGFTASEHHFTYDAFMPLPLQALAAAGAATEKIRFITGAMLPTLYDPLEAAQMAATADVVTNGRITLGLGMGYRPHEFDGFGTAKKTRGVRLTQLIEIIDKATAQDRFSYEGKHYQYENTAVLPRSIQRPMDILFAGGPTLKGAERAAKAGVGYWLANSPYEATKNIAGHYRKVAKDAGQPESKLRLAAYRDVFIGDTQAEAEELKQELLANFYEEHILGYGYLTDEKGQHLYNPPLDHPLYQRFCDSLFAGTVEMVIEELKRFEALGIYAVTVPPVQMELLSEKVLPEFKP